MEDETVVDLEQVLVDTQTPVESADEEPLVFEPVVEPVVELAPEVGSRPGARTAP